MRLIADARLRFELFVDAAPGLGEMLTIGNVWDLAQRRDHDRNDHRYDLVVLDGPASGRPTRSSDRSKIRPQLACLHAAGRATPRALPRPVGCIG